MIPPSHTQLLRLPSHTKLLRLPSAHLLKIQPARAAAASPQDEAASVRGCFRSRCLSQSRPNQRLVWTTHSFCVSSTIVGAFVQTPTCSLPPPRALPGKSSLLPGAATFWYIFLSNQKLNRVLQSLQVLGIRVWDDMLLMAGPYGDPVRYLYDESIILIPECDEVRILSNTSMEFLQRVPNSLGIFAAINVNRGSSNLSAFSYDPIADSCVKGSSADPSLYLLLVSSDSDHLLRDLVWTLVVTFIFSLPLGLAILLFLKHYTKQLVYISIPFFIIIPIFFNFYWFAASTVSSTCSDAFPLGYRILLLVFVFLIIGVLVWIIVSN